jgi:hypothetical protein
MPHRLLNIDYGMIMLNATSIATLTLSWFSDNLNSWGGFIVMMSVAYLNFAKAQNLRKGNKDEDK